MKKSLLKVAIASALTVSFAVPALANPFADVEKGHWAYDAVENLADAGVIEGYGDDTFRGDKNITRYEMAQMIAKAMKGDLNGEQKATVDKLAREFSSELHDMGVAIDEIKTEQERVKITGDARVRYGASKNHNDGTDFRARVNFDGKVNDKIDFNTRISSGDVQHNGPQEGEGIKLDTANVSFDALGLSNTFGRQDIFVGNGVILDDTINGLSTEYGGLKVFYGNQASEDERLFGAEWKTGLLDELNLNYINADLGEGLNDKEFYGVNAAVGIGKNMTLNADYAKENKSGDNAYAYGLSFDKIGLSATYKNVGAGAFTKYSSASGDIHNVSFMEEEGFKGMEYKFTKEVADNTVLTLAYQDFKNQDGSKKENRTAAYLNVNF